MKKLSMTRLAELVSGKRKEKSMTQQELADATGACESKTPVILELMIFLVKSAKSQHYHLYLYKKYEYLNDLTSLMFPY